MLCNSPDYSPPEPSQLAKVLDNLETEVLSCGLNSDVVKEATPIIVAAKSHLLRSDLESADMALSRLLVWIQRNMGAEISLRQAFEWSNLLVEDVRRYIADAAHLYLDAKCFGGAFIDISRSSKVPLDYLSQRPFPKHIDMAFENVSSTIRDFELPEGIQDELLFYLEDLREVVSEVEDGVFSDSQSEQYWSTLTDLRATISQFEGSYLSTYQVNTLLGIILFAWPGWLCAIPLAWKIQAAAVLVVALVAGAIWVGRTIEGVVAYKHMWGFIEPCTKSVKQVVDELKDQIKDFSDGQIEDLTEGFEEQVKALRKVKGGTHNERRLRARQIKKLNACITHLNTL